MSARWVAPLAGAWIEIGKKQHKLHHHRVAPLAGAWIEICQVLQHLCRFIVAPLAGAWIEIGKKQHKLHHHRSRSPRGSVD